MFRLGADFQAGRQGDTYRSRTGQWWPWALLFAFLQLIVLGVSQMNIQNALFGIICDLSPDSLGRIASVEIWLAKALIISIFPAAILSVAFSWWSSGLKNPTTDRGLPLHWPDMGLGGWSLTIGGFIVFMYLAYWLTFTTLGIDPQTYAPTSDGLNDAMSSAGRLEKTLADLADEPLLFAFALPGVLLGAPVSEELIFRGALFSALRNSWFGKSGAVVLTSAAWALIHAAGAPWLFVFMIFVMGLALGLLLLRFGSLWVTIIVHAVWNAQTTLGILGTVGK